MADEAQLFRTTINGSGTAVATDAMQSGQSPAAKNGIIGFAFRDSSGNVVLPQLDSAGRLPITQSAGTCLHDWSKQTPVGVGLANAVDLATLTLAVSTTYKEIQFNASCFRDAVIQIVQIDDVTETVLFEALVGSGAVNVHDLLECLEVTSGASGTQQLVLRGYNLDKISDIRGYLGALEPA